MSSIKNAEERQQDQRDIAISIAIEAGSLNTCEHHEGILLEGSSDITEAFKLGNYKFKNKMLENTFDNVRQMTDAIDSVIKEHPLETCSECDKWDAE